MSGEFDIIPVGGYDDVGPAGIIREIQNIEPNKYLK